MAGRMRGLVAVASVSLATVLGVGVTVPVAHADGATGVPSMEWPLSTFDVQQIRAHNARGTNVVVAVVDSGVDANQVDLQGSVLPGAVFDGGSQSSGNGMRDSDTQGYHGTGMASIIAAHGHDVVNGKPTSGEIGLADQAKILPVQVGVGESSASPDDIASGVRWAVMHGARVINISMGSTVDDPSLRQAVAQAAAANVVVVAAVGNQAQQGTTQFPAAYPYVVAVSGITQKQQFWPTSNYGQFVTLAGPAQQVVQVGGPTTYASADGTSGAAAYVSAEAALLIGANPSWTAGQVIRDMIQTATPGPGQRAGQRSDQFGYGIMNPLAALEASAPSNLSNPLEGAGSGKVGTTSGGSTKQGGSGTQPTHHATATSSSNTGLIVGVVVGVVLLVAVAILVIALVRRSRRGNQPPPGGPSAGYGPQGYGQQPGPYQN